MKRIWILTETGDNIGFGHISRCSSIAKALTPFFKVSMLIHQIGNSEYEVNFNEKIKVQKVNWRKIPEKWIKNEDIVLVDSYLVELDFFYNLKVISKKTIVIDDYYRLKYPCAMIINPNVSAKLEKYSYSQDSNLIGGKDYVILRSEFRNLHIKKPNNKVKKIVITVGGSDYRNLLPLIIENVCTKYPEIDFHILTGEEHYQKKLENNYPYKKLNFYGFLNAKEMVKIFLDSDIAISAAGQTLGELLITSTPFVTFSVDIDQKPIQNFYLNQNIIFDKIEWDDLNFEKKIIKSLNILFKINERQKFIEKSRNIIDDKGIERITKAIKKQF